MLSFAIMAGLGAVFYFGSQRSETLSGLGGPGRDERWRMIDLRATALTGLAIDVALIAGYVYEVAQRPRREPVRAADLGRGLAYVLSVAFLRWRS